MIAIRKQDNSEIITYKNTSAPIWKKVSLLLISSDERLQPIYNTSPQPLPSIYTWWMRGVT